MNRTKWVGLLGAIVLPLSFGCAQVPVSQPAYNVAPPPAGPAPVAAPALSPAASEVVRLAEAGTSDDVLLAYIQNSQGGFNLAADQILYLRDIGVSSAAITAMLNRDNALRTHATSYTAYTQTPPPAPVPVQETVPPPPTQAPPPDYVSSPPPDVGYFYDDLSPYGAWVQLDGVGWCWQPSVVVVNHAWRPYCDGGHWVCTDAGWFWQSDYSWGWAPFHYGRWQLHDRCGWVWVPDRVWGPAWVTWRVAGDNCGWAPLPPHANLDLHTGWHFNGVSVGVTFGFGLAADHFTFVAMKDFNQHDLVHHRMPPAEVTRVYHQTTVVNNYVVNNTTIINQGVKVDRVAAATRTEVRKFAIHDVPATSHGPMPAHGNDHNAPVVYRAQLKAPTVPIHAVAQKVDAQHPVVQHHEVAPANLQTRTTPGAGTWSPANNAGTRPETWKAPTTTPGKPSTYQQGRPITQPYQPAQPAQSSPSAPPAPHARDAGDPKTQGHSAANYQSEPPHQPQTPAPTHAGEAANVKSPTYPAATYHQQSYAPAPAAHETASAHASSPPTTRVNEDTKQPVHPVTSSRSEVTMNSAPTHNPGTVPYAQASPNKSTVPSDNPHVYFPKSAHQAAEAHTLPPLNPGPAMTAPANSSGQPSKKGNS